MRRILIAAFVVASAGSFLPDRAPAQSAAPSAALTPASQPADVPVKTVVLFSSGVGYFEHFGPVQGTGSTELHFKTQQINDLLKSLLLEDLDGGKVTAVTYPSQAPVTRTLQSFRVDISDSPGLGDLLDQLRGTKVKVIAGNGEAQEGTILGLEVRNRSSDKEGTTISYLALNLLQGTDLVAVDLDSVRRVQVPDPKIQDELNKALLTVAHAHDQDKKPITIHFDGQGQRHVRIGYVVETPVWKASYRLVLPPEDQTDAATKPAASAGKLQGWAIVENQTDMDWSGVQLSLVSGRPVSFIQDLYQPLYLPRPVVQGEFYASLRPQTYDQGLDDKPREIMNFTNRGWNNPSGGNVSGGSGGNSVFGSSGGGSNGRQYDTRDLATDAESDASKKWDRMVQEQGQPRAPIDPTASVASIASASQVGELFQYTVGSVSLPRQQSAMLPIVTDPIEVQRVSIYNQAVMPHHPLNGAILKNTTKKHLLAGPVTVLDSGSYAGDARLNNVPPGQERLVSYGIDLQMQINADVDRTEITLVSGKIVKGILQLSRRHLSTREYLAQNKGEHDKSLIVEHPVRSEWKLVLQGNDPALTTPKPVETTDKFYRFKGTVPAGKTTRLVVNEEMVEEETLMLASSSAEDLDPFMRSNHISQTVKDALAKAMQLQGIVTQTQRLIGDRNQQITRITQEQARIRQNMNTVEKTTPYYSRLMTKLNDQETQLEKLQGEIDDLQKTLGRQNNELESYLASLSVP